MRLFLRFIGVACVLFVLVSALVPVVKTYIGPAYWPSCGPGCDCYQTPVKAKSGYAKMTLDCGCTLLARTNTDCCKRDYPELAAAMEQVLSEAKKHLDESVEADNPRPASGVYERVYMSCGCSLIVYKPDSCPCFTAKDYPKLVESLNEVYRLALKNKVPAVPVEVVR